MVRGPPGWVYDPGMSEHQHHPEPPRQQIDMTGSGIGILGAVILIAGVIGGAILANDDRGRGSDAPFDWTLFLLAAGPAVVAFAVCWAASSIIGAVKSRP